MNHASPDSRPHRAPTERWLTWIALTAVFVLGCVLRVRGVAAAWLNPDEGIYYSMVKWTDWSAFWAEYLGNAHPPLFYLLLRVIGECTDQYLGLRMLPLVAGCAGVPAMYLLARECAGSGRPAVVAGLLGALMLALSEGAVTMSQIVRPYTLQITLLTLALYYLVRFVQRGGGRCMPLYTACMGAAILTHYSSFLVFGAVLGTLTGMAVFRQFPRDRLRSLILWNAPILVAVLLLQFLHIQPRLEGSALQEQAVTGWLRPYMLHDAAHVWSALLGALALVFDQAWEGPALLALLAGLVTAAVWRRPVLLWFPLTLLAITIVAAAAKKYPFGCTRHSLYLVLAFLPPIAMALAKALTKPVGLILGAVLLLCLVLPTTRPWLTTRVSTTLAGPDQKNVSVPERIIAAADVAKYLPAVQELQQNPVTVLTSLQGYYTLIPLYVRERERMQWSKNRGFFHFRWGKCTVVVFQFWEFTIDDRAYGTPEHLYSCVKAVDAELPALRFGQDPSVVMVFGGWSSEMPVRLSTLRWHFFPDRKPVRSYLGDRGLLLMRFDMATYKAEVERILSQGRRQNK
ncbi:MAG: glycosyltransferase family 39 protein [Planctomycetes bacterium]|nr:glycosyltransferase family 39 protein [Planctomycetota bacterium]